MDQPSERPTIKQRKSVKFSDDTECPTAVKSRLCESFEMYLKYHHEKSENTNQASKQLGLSNGEEEEDPFPMFRRVEKTGVIFATAMAKERGFHPEDPTWANMGQGAPECEALPDAPPRDYKMDISFEEMEYAPTTGITALRDKVATYYNHLYRQGKQSQYKAENVCIVPGGRAGITRIMAVLGETQVGFFNPDYTAYEVCYIMHATCYIFFILIIRHFCSIWSYPYSFSSFSPLPLVASSRPFHETHTLSIRSQGCQ